jgi:Mrp family chromosome partitioning ATPase
MHVYLGLGNEIGLSSVLAGVMDVSEVLRTVRLEKFLPPNAKLSGDDNRRRPGKTTLQKDLMCMTTGPLPPNPAELLSSSKMADVLTSLGSLADYVILDSPPVLLVADALSIAPQVDGVILVARTNSTLSDEARNTRTALDRVGARLIGVVVGGVKANKRHGYHYGYYSPIDELSV